MPLTKKDREVRSNFSRYGDDADRVFYSTLNKRINEGKPINIPESKRLKAKRRRRKKSRLRHKRTLR